ncbi:asialoglycoprotein receptor 1-like [Scyliorhinus canicula]|uniref:asialoglycoprotein receptor 1-like n=1 Tax=Scyliorhinus canicula TaxID=7830 RepID=UPI0018F2B07B|nr:asialoglycoprotein receptor 1-like [Scyliorhinus canicula]
MARLPCPKSACCSQTGHQMDQNWEGRSWQPGRDIRCRHFYKILAVIHFIVCVIVVVILALTCRDYKQFKVKYSQLEQSHNCLQTNYSQLEQRYNHLHTNYSQLEQSYNHLQTNNSQLQQSYNHLHTNYSQLEQSYNHLHTNYSQLEQSYNHLQTNNSQLEQSYNRLHTNYSQLEQRYNHLHTNCSQLKEVSVQTLDRVRVLLNAVIDNGISSTCPVGWQEFNKTCYHFSAERGHWHNANSSCVAKNTTLAIVTSQGQQNFIETHDRDKRWIGLTDLEQVGVYRWVNGDQLVMGFWARDEPNNAGVERCVTKGARYDPNKWNNDVCTTVHQWICQITRFDYVARQFGLEVVLNQ